MLQSRRSECSLESLAMTFHLRLNSTIGTFRLGSVWKPRSQLQGRRSLLWDTLLFPLLQYHLTIRLITSLFSSFVISFILSVRSVMISWLSVSMPWCSLLEERTQWHRMGIQVYEMTLLLHIPGYRNLWSSPCNLEYRRWICLYNYLHRDWEWALWSDLEYIVCGSYIEKWLRVYIASQ